LFFATMSFTKDCEWMYGDAATGALGIAAFARYNAFRWSGSLSYSECIDQLRDDKERLLRPVVLKSPSGFMAKEMAFPTQHEAINWLIEHSPEKKKDLKEKALESHDRLTHYLRNEKELSEQMEELSKQLEEMSQALKDCDSVVIAGLEEYEGLAKECEDKGISVPPPPERPPRLR